MAREVGERQRRDHQLICKAFATGKADRAEESSTDFADYTDLECKHDKGFSNLRNLRTILHVVAVANSVLNEIR